MREGTTTRAPHTHLFVGEFFLGSSKMLATTAIRTTRRLSLCLSHPPRASLVLCGRARCCAASLTKASAHKSTLKKNSKVTARDTHASIALHTILLDFTRYSYRARYSASNINTRRQDEEKVSKKDRTMMNVDWLTLMQWDDNRKTVSVLVSDRPSTAAFCNHR